MKNKYLNETIISTLLIGLLLVFINPLGLLMPTTLVSMLIILFLIFFGLFTALIWKEKAKDEREKVHKFFAGHLAFLAGSLTLVLIIAYQEFIHDLDPFLVYILIIMLIFKILGRIYADKNF